MTPPDIATGFADMLTSMEKLFQARADKAEGHAESAIRTSKDYWLGFAAAYQDAAKECRDASNKMRAP